MEIKARLRALIAAVVAGMLLLAFASALARKPAEGVPAVAGQEEEVVLNRAAR